jgi:hypothetical protein
LRFPLPTSLSISARRSSGTKTWARLCAMEHYFLVVFRDSRSKRRFGTDKNMRATNEDELWGEPRE